MNNYIKKIYEFKRYVMNVNTRRLTIFMKYCEK